MNIIRSEYKIVWGCRSPVEDLEGPENRINELAAEGFRIVSCASSGKVWCWTLERRVAEDVWCPVPSDKDVEAFLETSACCNLALDDSVDRKACASALSEWIIQRGWIVQGGWK